MVFKEGEEKNYWELQLREKYPFHPAADRFPMMDDDEFDSLVADMKENGQNKAITTLNGCILDGRNRFKACLKIGLDPIFEEFKKPVSSAEAFVFSENFHRRHLSKDQQKEMAINLHNEGKTQSEIAILLKKGQATIQRWVKDNIQMNNTETRTDSMGRQRPTKYNKTSKSQPEETEEEKLAKRMEEARGELQSWKESFEDLGQKVIETLLREAFPQLPHSTKKALKQE